MNLPFTTLPDLMQYFNSEERARDFLEKVRWPNGKVVCPYCNKAGAYRNCDFKTYTCKEGTCKARFSVTVGSMMENTKLPLCKWFAAIWLITNHKKGISSCQLARDLGIGQKAAWFLNHRIREMVMDKAPDKLDNICEVDSCYIGGRWANMRKTKRTRLQQAGVDNKVPVMGILQRDGKARLTIIGKDSFKDVVRKNVNNDAVVVTDEHLGFKGLGNEYRGHISVNHSQLEFKTGIYYTNSVEGFFALLKRSIIGIYHQVSPKHLHRYCEETSYRYNTRKIKDVNRFMDAMQKTAGRLTYNKLVGEGRKPKIDGIEFINE
jgi:transposase-like protein